MDASIRARARRLGRKPRCAAAVAVSLLAAFAPACQKHAPREAPPPKSAQAAEAPPEERTPVEDANAPARDVSAEHGKFAKNHVSAGLDWLAAAQEGDGHWSSRGWGGAEERDVGVTGLALLAFSGAGRTHKRGRLHTTVAKALEWLKARQERDGRFPWRTFDEQGIATLAVCEAYGLTADKELRPVARRAIDYILSAQPSHGGFGPQGAATKEAGDMLSTGWQILAFEGAVRAELLVLADKVDDNAARFRTFLGNTYRGEGASAERVGSKEPTPTATAIGTVCRTCLGGDYGREIEAGAKWLLDYEKRVGGAGQGQHRLLGDPLYSYFGTLAMCRMEGSHWSQWRKLSLDPFERVQVETGRDERGRPLAGSWDPACHYGGNEYGRVGTTALAILVLETWPRFPRYH